MATQDKLVIKYPDNDGIKVIDLDEVNDGDVLFDFNEFGSCALINQSNVKIELDCISCLGDKQYIECKNNILILKPYVEYEISDNDERSDISYLPGRYLITLNNGDRIKHCYFDVTYNKEMPIEGMDNIIKLIDEFVSGLSTDVLRDNALALKDLSVTNEYYVHEYLLKNEKKIVYALNNVLSMLQTTIVTDYKLEDYAKKQNAKSIRMNMLRTNDNKYFNVIKKPSANTIENIILKKELLVIDKDLRLEYAKLNDIKNNKLAIKHELEVEISDLEKAAKIQVENSIKKSINSHYKSLRARLNDSNKWLIKINLWMLAYLKVLKTISLVTRTNEFNSIDIQNNILVNTNSSNPNYRYLNEIYNKIHLRRDNQANKSNSSTKRSFELFEIYGFILIHNVLKDLGFSQQNNLDINVFDFESNLVFEYATDNYYVKLRYDYYCDYYFNQAKGNPVCINSHNQQPDYIIEIYDQDHKFINMMIVEMKYRRLSRLIDKNIITKTDLTINDYHQLAFLDEGEGYNFKYPKYVSVIYPSLEESCFEHYLANYVGINASLAFDESKAYQRLKELIEGCM